MQIGFNAPIVINLMHLKTYIFNPAKISVIIIVNVGLNINAIIILNIVIVEVSCADSDIYKKNVLSCYLF
jgi:hypothetical protein